MDKNEQWEENQKKKEYLNGYRNAKKREKRILEQIQQLRLDKMFPAMQYDDMPHGTNISDLSDYAVKMDELMDKLEGIQVAAEMWRIAITHKIRRVDDYNEREVLRLTYIEFLSANDIGSLTGHCRRNVYNILDSAIEHIEI